MPPFPPSSRPLSGTLGRGFAAGTIAGLLMLIAMATLRLVAGLPTPTELIFDRLFPLLTVDFFLRALAWAGGDTPLKLDGVYVALMGQLLGSGLAGTVYALYLRRRPTHQGEWLVGPGVLAVTLLSVALLWPTLLTSYRGLPPQRAMLLSGMGMLLSYTVYGLSLMAFHRLLTGSQTLSKSSPDRGADRGRRAFLATGASVGLSVILGILLRRLYRLGTFSYDGRQYSGPGGQRITPIRPDDQFYEVSRNLVDPDPARSLWRLEITGQVDTPRVYTFAELAGMPSVTQETTLLSMFYEVGGGLCSNARWKGVPLVNLLDVAKPWGDNAVVLFHAADGYYETIPFDKALEPTTLLAYEMNGEPLPQRHGYPLRLIVPGLYGEKSAKWLTRIELVDRADPRLDRPHGLGFYREQGWGPEAVIPTHSRIDAPEVDGDEFAEPFRAGQPTEFRGMAFGGDRGISKVELSTDDGQTWTEVEIHQPGTKITWSQWRHPWSPPATANDLHVVVRATDGDGRPQITQHREPAPRGATGLHRIRARIDKNAV